MLTRTLSFVALLSLITLLVIALPNFVNSFNTNPSVTSIIMSGLVVLMVLAGAIMLLLLGVIGINGKPKNAN